MFKQTFFLLYNINIDIILKYNTHINIKRIILTDGLFKNTIQMIVSLNFPIFEIFVENKKYILFFLL